MRRRDLICGTAVTMAAWRASAEEAPKSARIGFIVTGEAFPRHGFDEAMRRLGWVEGHNLTVERRITGENSERRKFAAAELVAANPDVIVAAGIADALPVRAQTRTLPIVVIGGTDLVEEGLADSLAHPGANVTGIVVLRGELDAKRFELLRELVPAARECHTWPTHASRGVFAHGCHRGPRTTVRRAGYRETPERRRRAGGCLCRECG